MSQINFICPNCGHSAVLPASLVGKQGKCPGCQTIVTVTNTPAPSPMPVPVPLSNAESVPEPPTVPVLQVAPKSSKRKWWIIGGSSAVVLTAVVLFFVLGGDDSNEITNDGNPDVSVASNDANSSNNDLQSLFGGSDEVVEQPIEVTTVSVTGQLTNNRAEFDLAEDNFSITFTPLAKPDKFVDARCNVNPDGSFSVHSIYASDTNPTPTIFEGLPPGDYRVSLTAKHATASPDSTGSVAADSDEFSSTYSANSDEDSDAEAESPELLTGDIVPEITIAEGNAVVVVNIEVFDNAITVTQ